jgi:hypothetical protein
MPRANPRGLKEYDLVELTAFIKRDAYSITPGTRGVIVHSHRNGVAFEVEFNNPTFDVVTVSPRDLIRADA